MEMKERRKKQKLSEFVNEMSEIGTKPIVDTWTLNACLSHSLCLSFSLFLIGY